MGEVRNILKTAQRHSLKNITHSDQQFKNFQTKKPYYFILKVCILFQEEYVNLHRKYSNAKRLILSLKEAGNVLKDQLISRDQEYSRHVDILRYWWTLADILPIDNQPFDCTLPITLMPRVFMRNYSKDNWSTHRDKGKSFLHKFWLNKSSNTLP